nr:MAG TPA: hypothetical protein [Caudoviricetes sp.]
MHPTPNAHIIKPLQLTRPVPTRSPKQPNKRIFFYVYPIC